MSIDEKLYASIENNTNIVDKLWFNNSLQFAKAIYNTFDVDYNFENILDVVKNIKIERPDSEEVYYDMTSNTLVLGSLSENKEYDLCKSFLQITSQKGLTRTDSQGNEYWSPLNNIIIDKLILYVTGINKVRKENEDITIFSKEDEKRLKEDEVLYNITQVVPTKELIDAFANAKGEELYNKYFQNQEDIVLQTI